MGQATRVIQQQLQELLWDPPPGVNAGPTDDDDLFTWTGAIQGPAGTPYEGGLFFLSILFPESYPFDPPRVKFTTPLYHPNVSAEGDICLSILLKRCSWEQGWTPALSISGVLLSLCVLLQEPNTDHGLRPDLAKQYLDDREGYNAAARSCTCQHAM